MNFGIHIGHMGGPLAEMRKLWKFADARGFDWFSVSDHFQESPPFRCGPLRTIFPHPGGAGRRAVLS